MGWGSSRRRFTAGLVAFGLIAFGSVVVVARSVVVTRVAATASAPVPDLASLGWTKVFADEFDGSSVDESVWDVLETDSHGIQSRDALSVGGGNLTITTYTGSDGRNRTGSIVTGGDGASEPTWDGFELTYGYVEARIRLPDGPDTDTAFWLFSHNGNNSKPFGDPAADGPEIDVMEHGNGPTSRGDTNGDGICDWNGQAKSLGVACNELLGTGGHWDGFDEDHKLIRDGFVKNTTGTPLQGNFHTYGVLWGPGFYRYYIDGQETASATVGATFSPESIALTQRPGKAAYGDLAASTEKTTVDYVRAWQRPISEIPNQVTAANTPLAVPLTVADYSYGSTGIAEPGSVTLWPISSNTSVVAADGFALSGGAPMDPDGSFTNGGFESGGNGWAMSGAALVGGGKVHAGSAALHLGQEGGRATQTITGLRPGTTYAVDANYEVNLGYTDSNGNGRVDAAEPFTDSSDTIATFDWGIVDVDAARAGDQPAQITSIRDGLVEQAQAGWEQRQAWPQEVLKFTTGPTTTSVTLFADNRAYAGRSDDSEISLDSVTLRPLVPADRTLVVQPVAGATGQTTITLIATNAAGKAIGTESFDVTVGAGTLLDGGFETPAAASPWRLSGSAQLTTPNPFRPDQQLSLATSSVDTVSQPISGLEPASRYRVTVTGSVDRAGGDVAVYAQNYDGSAMVGTSITTTTSTTRSFEFTTGPSTASANLLAFDWDTGDGPSTLEAITLAKCASASSCATSATTVPNPAPLPVSSVGYQLVPAGAPASLHLGLPAGATLTGVTSSNDVLVPDSNLAVTGSGSSRAVTFAPVPDHTGRTSLAVSYTGAAGSPVTIPVVVHDAALRQPGFEQGSIGWTLAGSQVNALARHSGTTSLLVPPGSDARQTVTGLPHGTNFTFSGWVNGAVTVTLRTVPVETGETSETLATARWAGFGWAESTLDFTSVLLPDTASKDWKPVEVVVANEGNQAAFVDDLAIVHRPSVRRLRDLSLHSADTEWAWQGTREVSFGRTSPNAPTEGRFTVGSADIAGFGSGVVPAANLDVLQLFGSAWPFYVSLNTKAGTKTGRSRVSATLSDPATGNATTQSFVVTVNAGDNFDNGDFERSDLGAPNGDWVDAWANDSAEIRRRQSWRYLGVHNTGWAYVGPQDDNKTLRISSGAVKWQVGDTSLITGLSPSTTYEVAFRAKGSGSTVVVRAYDDIIWAPALGSATVTPPNSDNVWRDYSFTFTTAASGDGSTSVALYLVDDDLVDGPDAGTDIGPSDAVPASSRACARYAAGETCFDDLGIFKASDVS